jgi:hypothetical protein
MTDEKKKPQEGEVSDKELEDVAGGVMRQPAKKIPTTYANTEGEEEEVQT